ncbi:zinc ABC transporter substrate-binding protein [Serratia liquefaciens]|nr:zinc ABC transporter substrate-binding protein [Serratia liquefaciens]RYM67763.1 zinc ABC transporter substrate-binding protein [Serratia liquefaciens]RYM74988.1 zinc ABC transporter substrate-binding protein [Serratia liquefaciens]
MEMIEMTKLEIYTKMFDLVLPYVRSIQSQNCWVKARDMSCYFETELIHNLPKSILEKDMVEHDVWFLNNQARYYFEKCNEDISPNYNQHLIYIKKLIDIVPEDLKSKLTWVGP